MDENNDIIRMLRDREDEFRLPLRSDGWEKLEADLTAGRADRPLAAVQPAISHRAYIGWASVAAVALLCLLVSVPLLLEKEPVKVVSESRKPQISQPADQPEAGNAIVAKTPVLTSVPEIMPEFRLEDTAVYMPEPLDVHPRPAGNKHPSFRQVGPEPERKHTFFYVSSNGRRHSDKLQRWSFGIQAGSNGIAGAKGGFSHMDPSLTDPGPHPDPDPDDSGKQPQTKAAVGGGSGGNHDVNYFYRHHLPVTFGFSFRRNIISRFTLETGITYTYLYSDILEERKDKSGNQKLHYIGIPLKAGWTFYSNRVFSLYVSAGGAIEYCISATNTQKDLHIHRWQPSLNAAAGMQVTMVKPWSFFVEPGVSYYYDMNPRRLSGLSDFSFFETIRQVHPLTFNLQVGLRFTY